MTDIQDVDRVPRVVDLVDDSIALSPYRYPVKRYRRLFEFLATAWAWVVFKRLDSLKNPRNLLLGELEAVDFL